MANNPSAKKRVRQNLKRRLVNQANRSRMRTFINKLRKLVKAGDVKTAKESLPKVYSEIDITAKKGGINKGTADRYKSRLSQLVKAADTQ